MVCAGTLLLWPISLEWPLGLQVSNFVLAWYNGGVSLDWYANGVFQSRIGTVDLRYAGPLNTDYGFHWPHFNLNPTASSIEMPCWLLMIAAGAPTVFLFLLDRRRIPAGHCKNCGYNLTGNMSGVCPECGSRISSLNERQS